MAWELKVPIKVLVHDRDSKYSSEFDTVFSAAGIRIARTPFRSPGAKQRPDRAPAAVHGLINEYSRAA